MATFAAPNTNTNTALAHSSYHPTSFLTHPRLSSSFSLPPFQSSHSHSISHPPRFPSRYRPFRIAAEATSGRGNDLDGLAARLVEKAIDAALVISQRTRHFFQSAGHKALEFQEGLDLQANILQALRVANLKLEEFGYDARKKAEKWNRTYRISQKAQHVVDFASEKARNVDQQFGLGQKARNVSLDLSRNWPTYTKRVDKFLQTPLGKTLSTLVFLWLVLSGWLFRIIFLSLWILPLAAPFLISAATRNAIVEGACPSCKRRFIGNRSQVIVCNYCRAVVWQPREDFSRDDSDPRIIDVDIDYK